MCGQGGAKRALSYRAGSLLRRNRYYRRLVIGHALSSLGDGVSNVAIPWIALDLAPRGAEGIVVALSVSAYYVPGLILSLISRPFRTIGTGRLIALDAGWRSVSILVIAHLALSDALGVAAFLLLLSASSLFHAIGTGSRRAIVPDLVGRDSLLEANALISTLAQVGLVIGPALGGILITRSSAALALVLDGVSFALMFIFALGLPPARVMASEPASLHPLKRLWRRHRVRAAFLVTFGFFLLYGPLEVALPLKADRTLAGGASTLGYMWTAFGVAAFVSTVLTARGILVLRPSLRTLAWIVTGWGAATIAVGATNSVVVAIGAMAVGGAIFGPYQSVISTLLQEELEGVELREISGAWAGLLLLASPVGVLAAAPVVNALGATSTLVITGGACVILGLAVVARTVTSAGDLTRTSASTPDHHLGQ